MLLLNSADTMPDELSNLYEEQQIYYVIDTLHVKQFL